MRDQTILRLLGGLEDKISRLAMTVLNEQLNYTILTKALEEAGVLKKEHFLKASEKIRADLEERQKLESGLILPDNTRPAMAVEGEVEIPKREEK